MPAEQQNRDYREDGHETNKADPPLRCSNVAGAVADGVGAARKGCYHKHHERPNHGAILDFKLWRAEFHRNRTLDNTATGDRPKTLNPRRLSTNRGSSATFD